MDRSIKIPARQSESTCSSLCNLSSIPVIIILIIVLSRHLTPLLALLLILLSNLIPRKHTRPYQPSLKIPHREVIGIPSQPFKPHNPIRADAIDERNHAGQHLHAQSRDQEGTVVHVDLEDPGFVVRRRERLSSINTCSHPMHPIYTSDEPQDAYP